jgi:hypothetical protein
LQSSIVSARQAVGSRYPRDGEELAAHLPQTTLPIGEWPQPYHGAAFLLIVAGIFVASSRK